MERGEVLDDYFDPIRVVAEDVDEAAGWRRIGDFPSLWDRVPTEA